MNAADTSASSAIADWTPMTAVGRSSTTAEIDTFITDVSTTRTNIAIASRTASLRLPVDGSAALLSGAAAVISVHHSVAAGIQTQPWCPLNALIPAAPSAGADDSLC